MSHLSSEKKNMSYQRMSSSTDCSDEDDDNQPSSLMKYWAEIRPSSTDEDSEPEVTPARTSRFEVSSSTECPHNENPRAENTSPSQTSSISDTNLIDRKYSTSTCFSSST